METLASSPPPSPDAYFWYAICIVLVSILVWIVNRYISRTERLFEELTKNINELIQVTKVHEHRISDAEDDIDHLKDRFDKNAK
jgi:hypothetical protein